MEIEEIVQTQRKFFETHQTKDLDFREKTLRKMKEWIQNHEDLICEALKEDLNKSETEAYMCEIGLTLSELNDQLKHFRKWARPHKVKTPLAQFYGKSFELAEPYGVVLVMSPWNYPFMLSLEPAIGAIAAGNCVIIKPSAYAIHVSHVIKKMIDETCDPKHVVVIEGGREENTRLLEQRFDYIFFTGSVEVGKLVMSKASRYLTPVSLELGGKSPCLIDKKADLKIAARRIAFGKYLNAGQTCVAVDYVLVHDSLKEEFIGELKKVIEEFFGEEPLKNEQLVKIINQKHFDRLRKLLASQKILIGGRSDIENRKIEPSVIDCEGMENSLMKEEIFGPILPVISYHDLDEAIAFIHQLEKPLAFYLFTNDLEVEKKCLNEISFGGGCINDTVIHLASTELGFGGVGHSGMGQYHGKKSFDTFSHIRSIVKKATWIDLPMRYYPFDKTKNQLIRKFMK